MITGLNKQLENALHVEVGSERSIAQAEELLKLLAVCAATGEEWLVPFQLLDTDDSDNNSEAENEDNTDGSAGLPEMFDDKNGFRMMPLLTTDNELLIPAFTSTEAIIAAGELMPPMTLKYPVKKLMEDFLKNESCEVIALNPGNDSIYLKRDTVEMILENANANPPVRWHKRLKAEIAPVCALDANAIINDWNDAWVDSGKEEPWKILCYPIMPDGTVLAVFEQVSELILPDSDDTHTFNRYRVLQYTPENKFSVPIAKFRFSAQDAEVGTVFLYEGKLRVCLKSRTGSAYSVIQVVPNDDEVQFKVFANINTAIMGPNGEFAVAYYNNLHDNEHVPIAVFDRSGEVIECFCDDEVLEVSDVTYGGKDKLWFYPFPGDRLYTLNETYTESNSHYVGVQGFSDFCITDDEQLLITRFGTKQESVFYVLPVDKDGDYPFPIKLKPIITSPEGETINASDCEIFGRVSTRGSNMLLNVDGVLWYFDFEELMDKRMKLFLPKK